MAKLGEGGRIALRRPTSEIDPDDLAGPAGRPADHRRPLRWEARRSWPRLTAGTREGAEVTVRDVSVVEVGDSIRGTSPDSGFGYPCKWIVVARVRHLQHVHHRQNIYNGNVVVRVDGDRWKIAGVELTSEDRIVLPWNPK